MDCQAEKANEKFPGSKLRLLDECSAGGDLESAG